MTQTSKLDKADILELTVSYVKLVHFEEAEVAKATKRRYKAGYLSCAREAMKCVDKSLNVNETVKSNLEQYLTTRCDMFCEIDAKNTSCNPSYPDQQVMEPISVRIPTATFQNANMRCLRPLNVSPDQTNMLTFADSYYDQSRYNTVLDNNALRTGDDVKAFSSEITWFNAAHRNTDFNDNPKGCTNMNSVPFSKDLLDYSGNDITHSLNISAADSSFNGDVWRPW